MNDVQLTTHAIAPIQEVLRRAPRLGRGETFRSMVVRTVPPDLCGLGDQDALREMRSTGQVSALGRVDRPTTPPITPNAALWRVS